MTIAVVEDDAGVRTALRELLHSAGYNVTVFASAEEFLVTPGSAGVACLIADVNLPGITGAALIAAIAERGTPVPAMLMTGRDDAATRELLRGAAAPVLRKPFGDRELFDTIRRLTST